MIQFIDLICKTIESNLNILIPPLILADSIKFKDQLAFIKDENLVLKVLLDKIALD